MKKIFLINCRQPTVEAFEKLGCEVRIYRSLEPVIDVEQILNEQSWKPDLLLQQESLGTRVFLKGLSQVNCLRVFWSIDTHMNMHWHSAYANLFDVLLTTQKKYIPHLSSECRAKVLWAPWMGMVFNEFEPQYENRKHLLSFVGRVSDERPSRKRFVKYLDANFPLNLQDSLTYSEMMSVYKESLIIPNEALFGEVNFRLFEGASCGACIITPDVGDELFELYEDGVEIETYKDVLELDYKLKKLQNDKQRAAKIGYAGFKRTLKSHTPEIRIKEIYDKLQSCSITQYDCDEEFALYWLAQAKSSSSYKEYSELELILNNLFTVHGNEDCSEEILRICARLSLAKPFLKIIEPYLSGELGSSSCSFYLAASIGCLKFGLWDKAKLLYYSYTKKINSLNVDKPQNEIDLLRLWGTECFRAGIKIRSGVTFDEENGIPTCALDCYLAIIYRNPDDLEMYRKVVSLLRNINGTEAMRIGLLSHLSLHSPEDWRISTDLAIDNFKIFRSNEGFSELNIARKNAEKENREKYFQLKIKQELSFSIFYDKI